MSNLPFFSVIVPTYNRPDRLRVCLQSLAALLYPPDRFEVIVVDDGGGVPLDPIAASAREHVDVTLIRQKNSGPAAARNRGAAAARGDMFAFTDDDCMPEPTWLHEFVRGVDGPSRKMLGGRTVNALPGNAFASASQTLIDYLYVYYNEAVSRSSFFTSNNIALPRGPFEDVGGFAVSFPRAAGEDREFCSRWLRHGLEMEYVPTAGVRHAHDLNARTFWFQHFNYGRAAFSFHRDRPDRVDEPLNPEPIAFYLNLIRYPFQTEPEGRPLTESVLLGVSQIANAAGYFAEALTSKGRRSGSSG